MKAVYAIFLAALLNMACSSGSSEEKPPVVPPSPTPTVTVTLEKQSISNGKEVDPATTNLLTLTYNVNVIVNSSYSITLNGNRLMAQSKENTVEIPLGLQAGKEYTLQLAEGAVIAASAPSVKAPALTLIFKTTAKEEPEDTYTIPTEPVTASAESAKKLYAYLLSQYGRKTISSVMADVNWNTICAEKVHALTGRYPAMNCYDFIHICYSAPNSWINYEDITPVTDWVNAGGLVQLMWHFNVPKNEGSTDYAFYTDGNNFKPSRALVSGTWENKWFYEQMDRVINILLKLQEANIAATWRPFHEAAGNATARQQASWTKAWFWWGIEGAEVYKRLWRAMFDYFQQKGVHNLIWVWTTQNYNGNSSSYYQDSNWYPGNQYVDIVARDLYGSNAAQNKQEFLEIQSTYPTKMVALGECGNNYDENQKLITEAALMSDTWTLGALWSHFMVWYTKEQNATMTMCSDDWWKDAMNNANVITRDQLPNLK